ncbi:predicted protein [Histoplasma mississippiense (nom. inval.)]|uniref:predicted protein n=1 Tax=Ajellomyces capsulatus (strain NAm1 / WU24) TaxID=2059318 RepID=UPI000157CB12|nr:predicted protein [Histoplasma mississippiense (nom. inval.)]EDN09145.1 predicted protein [Histoplasma mississippiense (nom. inval.)]
MDSDTRSYSPAVKFCLLFAYRYIRLLRNLIAFVRYKPIRPSGHDLSFTANNVAVIIPTLEGSGEQLVNTLESILKNEPQQIILSTIDENRQKAELIATSMQNRRSKMEVTSVPRPKKSHQIAIAIKRVCTEFVILADGDVLWPPCLVPWILDPLMGGVATCQRVQAPNNPRISQYIWWFPGRIVSRAKKLRLHCNHLYGMEVFLCLSGRTVAYRAKILQSCKKAFVKEAWFGKLLNADDDNSWTRRMVTHGYKTYFQSHPNAEVLTTLEESPKFLKQCVRWSRSNWRSNLRSLFIDRAVWWTRGEIARLFNLPKPTTIAKAAAAADRKRHFCSLPLRSSKWEFQNEYGLRHAGGLIKGWAHVAYGPNNQLAAYFVGRWPLEQPGPAVTPLVTAPGAASYSARQTPSVEISFISQTQVPYRIK